MSVPTEGLWDHGLYVLRNGTAESAYATNGMLRPTSVKAALDLMKGRADQAYDTINGLSATATTGAPGTAATLTISGPMGAKVINIKVPRGDDGAPGMGYAEGLELTAAAQSAQADAAGSRTASEVAATRAENAEGVALAPAAEVIADTMSNSTTAAVKRLGVLTPTATTHAALQAALNSAATLGLRVQAGGTITTDQTLNIRCDADLGGLTYAYTGTGTAIVIGDAVNGLTRRKVRIGRVAGAGFTTGWGAGTPAVGVQLLDVNKSDIEIQSVTKFLTGVLMLGHLRGCAYNEIAVQELMTNKVNMHQTADDVRGFCNSNRIRGGSWNHNPPDAGGTNVPGTRHVLQDATGGGPVPDVNTFTGCDFEGNSVEYMIDSTGKMNTFRDCRWEAVTPRAIWRAGSFGNVIRDGYRCDLVQVTNGGARDNSITWPASGDVTEIEILPAVMVPVAGAPAQTNIVRIPVLAMANNDVVAFSWVPPINWHAYDVELRITHDTLSTADSTLWLWRTSTAGHGETITQPSGSTTRNLPTTAGRAVRVGIIEAGLPITPGKRVSINLVRSGGTLVGSACVLSVILRRSA